MKSLIASAMSMLNNQRQNEWVNGGGLTVYMRHGIHRVDIGVVDCLDIANVIAKPPGTGAFTAFLNEMETLVANHATTKYIFVESIMNDRLAAFLRRRGYSDQLMGGQMLIPAPNLFKRFD